MNRIAEIFRDSNIPLIVIRKVGETASEETTLHSFADGDNGYAIISNSNELHSPVTGEQLSPLEGLSETTKDAEELSNDKLSEMASDLSGHQLFMDMDLAFDLAGETIKSPLTGKDMVLTYVSAENASDDEDEDEESDPIEEDVVADVDSEIEEEVPDSDFDVVEDESLGSESDESDVIDEDPDAEVDEDVDTEELPEEEAGAEDEEDTAPEAIAPDAVLTLESEIDAAQPLRLVQTDNNGSEVAVFSGASYVGSMSRSKAATNTQTLFDNGSKLYAAFKSVVGSNTDLRSPEVAAFGFEPQQIKVPVGKLVADAVESAKAEVAYTIAADRKTYGERYKRALGISVLGISKGFFEGAGTLVGETASVLTKAGVANGERTARRALINHSESFTTAVMEKASELVDKSDDYLLGISESITKAEVKGDVADVTTVYEDSKPPAGETAGFVRPRSAAPTPKGGNRFTSLVGNIGRRAS